MNCNKEDSGESFNQVIRQFYDEPDLSEEEELLVEEMLQNAEKKRIKENCLQIIGEKETEKKNKTIRIGRLHLSRVACFIIVIIIISAIGGYAYAAVIRHIKSIEVKNYKTHGEVEVEYNDNGETVTLDEIEDYYQPVWVPDGYHLDSEFKTDLSYRIVYRLNVRNRIIYKQTLSEVNVHYSTEDGIHESVSFGYFTGEFITTKDVNYLIVTDGTYLYSLDGCINKDTMIKMLYDYNN
ncbi:MAG: DUF4367 domain-containing protein [Lachnospiraceae bacterium]|nr:DUF4367 domain-containing protein [Lachnospiraceae bacterium]